MLACLSFSDKPRYSKRGYVNCTFGFFIEGGNLGHVINKLSPNDLTQVAVHKISMYAVLAPILHLVDVPEGLGALCV